MAPLTDNQLLRGALWYAQNLGWKLLPVYGILPDGKCSCGKAHSSPKDIGKHAILTGRHEDVASSDPAKITEWWTQWPDANIGVWAKGSNLFTVDIDPRSGGDVDFARLEELVDGEIYPTVTANTGNYPVRGGRKRGQHLVYSAPTGYSFPPNLKAIGLNGIDIKHNGYFLVYPSRHITGVIYEWADGKAPWEVAVNQPGQKLIEWVAKESLGFQGAKVASGDLDRGTSTKGSWDFIDKLDLPKGDQGDLDELAARGIDEGGRAVGIYRLAIHYANKYGTDDADIEHIISTLQKYNYEKVSPPLEANELMRQITKGISFVQRNPMPKFQIESGFREKSEIFVKKTNAAKAAAAVSSESQPTPKAESKQSGFMPANTSENDDWQLDNGSAMDFVAMALDSDALDDEDGALPGQRSYSDTGNGRRFVDAFGQKIRYTPGLGWFVWNNKYWNPDAEDLGVRELVKKVPAMVANEAAAVEDSDMMKAAQKWAAQSKTSGAQNAAVKMAQTDPRIGVPVDYWDRDPYLIGVANGVVDLRTGTLLQGRPDLHITRRCPVGYTPGLEGLPRFQEFLDFATGYDKSYQKWLQRAMGYTLTGLNTLDVMFMMYGPPGSGKNVMVEALVKILGEQQYAFPLDSSVLAQADGKSNQADMYFWAEMRGRRMIWVDELPESERIKENQVKKLTGSSLISARSPGEKPFTFESQGKLWVTTNHRPIITDDAMWRRIRPIPWTQVPTKPDPSLKAYLHDPEGGLPAILAWAVQGAIEVLNSPEPDPVGWCSQVQEAAEMYRKNEDRIGLFLEEEFDQDAMGVLGIKEFYAPYNVWCEGRGERALSQIRFTNKLSERGLQITGSGNRAMIYGFKRRPLPDPSAPGISSINWNEILNSGNS
mgnify:CR=1 FL=1